MAAHSHPRGERNPPGSDRTPQGGCARRDRPGRGTKRWRAHGTGRPGGGLGSVARDHPRVEYNLEKAVSGPRRRQGQGFRRWLGRKGDFRSELDAQAEGSGALHETIPVLNTTSKRRFLARVEGKGRVSVDGSAGKAISDLSWTPRRRARERCTRPSPC